MRKTVLVLVLLLAVFPTAAQNDAATLISDFEANGITNWWTYIDDIGSTFVAQVDTEIVAEGGSALRTEFSMLPGGFGGIGFDFGTTYDWTAGEGIVLSLRASQAGIPLAVVLHLDDETQTSALTPGVTPFASVFVTPEDSVSDWVEVRLPWSTFQRLYWMGNEGLTEFSAKTVQSFEFAFEGLRDGTNAGTVWFDNVRVISDTDLNRPPTYDEIRGDIQPVRVNQLGYRPTDAKRFVVGEKFESFDIIDAATGEVVYSGSGEAWGFDADAHEDVYIGRFDDFQTPGTYTILVDDEATSYPFDIADDVYDEALVLAARALYLQRSGIDIDDADNSGLTLRAGHRAPAVLWGDPDTTPMDVSGGWYDAGDYGRYIATAAFAVNQLMLAYHANPDVLPDGALDIPESGNSVSDLLDELRWELEWMLKMQREDGAVYHKVTTRSFPGFGTLAADDTSQLFVFSESTPDTAYFAAVMAQASTTYAEVDGRFAARALDAAQRAWSWLAAHPEQYPPGGFKNPPVSEYPMQGGYDFVGEETMPRMWAAAELFKATGDAQYEAAFRDLFAGFDGHHTMSWANAYPLALYAYLSAANAAPALTADVAAAFQQQAAEIYAVTQSTGYGVALTDALDGFKYSWGSNQIALAHGLYLMLADELFPTEGYREAAAAQIHYLFGVNPLARAYFGGLGENPILHPHHNVAYRFQLSIPGFVGEGANSQGAGGDAVLIALQTSGAPPAHSYTDDWDSWASNEPTIDAQATFVALLAYVTAK